MREDIAELTKHTPHMHERARFSIEERRAYWMGYYAGVNMAIRCADAAFEKFALRVKTLKAATRSKRSA